MLLSSRQPHTVKPSLTRDLCACGRAAGRGTALPLFFGREREERKEESLSLYLLSTSCKGSSALCTSS
jgi:hypothetical protein